MVSTGLAIHAIASRIFPNSSGSAGGQTKPRATSCAITSSGFAGRNWTRIMPRKRLRRCVKWACCEKRPEPVMEASPYLSVVIPAYNEQERLKRFVPGIVRYLQSRGQSFEIIVVNDGSRDATARVARAFSHYASL